MGESKKQTKGKEKVDEMLKKIREEQNRILSQEQIDTLLGAMKPEPDYEPKNLRKIKIYDFKRPSRFSKEEIREISNVSENIARELTKFFASEYGMFPQFHVMSVDELTCEEFIRSVPTPTPCFNFLWMDCEGMFEMDRGAFFKGFLGANPKKPHTLNGLEKNVFINYIYNPIEKIIHKEFSNTAHKDLPGITEQEFVYNPIFLLKYNSPCDMGVLVTFGVRFGNEEEMMSLFLTQDLIEVLKENGFFTGRKFFQKKNTIIVPLAYPEPNTIVEAGRFRLEDDFKLQKNMIIETNQEAGAYVKIYKNGTHIAFGETVVIDDNLGVRFTKIVETPEEETFYNTRVIFGSCTTAPDEDYGEGSILQFTEWWNDPAKIIKDKKVIAYGELCMYNEKIGVKIKEVVE
jgi:flagellar motor switch protein FliM